jgi:hypothetical protein
LCEFNKFTRKKENWSVIYETLFVFHSVLGKISFLLNLFWVYFVRNLLKRADSYQCSRHYQCHHISALKLSSILRPSFYQQCIDWGESYPWFKWLRCRFFVWYYILVTTHPSKDGDKTCVIFFFLWRSVTGGHGFYMFNTIS